MIIFILLVVGVPYCIGFFALCLWWRWWLLLPASVIAIILKFLGLPGSSPDEPDGGPVLVTNGEIENFVAFGAVWGFLACCVVIAGRATKFHFAPGVVLPLVFFLGAAIRLLSLKW